MEEYTYTVKSADVINSVLYVEYTLLSNAENKLIASVPIPQNNTNFDYHVNRYNPFVEQPTMSGNPEENFENGL